MDDTEWIQKEFTLKARPRGFYLITREVLDHLPETRKIETGVLTSLSSTLPRR